MSSSLSRRLQALTEAHKTVLAQIQELQSLPPTAHDSSTRRVDLANDIHESLREQEDTLEILRQEVEDSNPQDRRRSAAGISSTEHERNADTVARLSEDLRTTRTRFRRAQLQAKRSAEDAKRKEREQLFKRQHAEGEDGSGAQLPIGRRPGNEKLTREYLERNAAEDVTRALRRTHNVLEANLEQSQFAQQALDESQEALRGLAESYGGVTDLLKSSRSLVGYLVSSNKSDTWYLQTAFYMLAITISWLVFRRLLYGPLWWLVWQPVKLMWWTTMSAAGAVGFGSGKAVQSGSMSISSDRGIPTFEPGQRVRVDLPPKGGMWGGGNPSQHASPPMVEELGQMAEDAQKGTNVDDISEEERRRQEEEPRNPKKRMMEVDVDAPRGKDEL